MIYTYRQCLSRQCLSLIGSRRLASSNFTGSSGAPISNGIGMGFLKDKQLTVDDLGPDKIDTDPLKMAATLNKKLMQDYCERHGLKKWGSKGELIARIRKHWKVDQYDHISSFEISLSKDDLFFINYSQGRLINNISSLANVVMKMDEAEAKLIMAGMPASIKKASQLWESFLSIKTEVVYNELHKSAEELEKISQITGVLFKRNDDNDERLEIKFLEMKNLHAAKHLLMRPADKESKDTWRLGIICDRLDKYSLIPFWDPSIQASAGEYFRIIKVNPSQTKDKTEIVENCTTTGDEQLIEEHIASLGKDLAMKLQEQSSRKSSLPLRTIARFGKLYLNSVADISSQFSTVFNDKAAMVQFLHTIRPSVHLLSGISTRDLCRLGNSVWSQQTHVQYRSAKDPTEILTVILERKEKDESESKHSLLSAAISSTQPFFQGFFQCFNRQYDFAIQTDFHRELDLGSAEEVSIFTQLLNQSNQLPAALPLMSDDRKYLLDRVEIKSHGGVALQPEISSVQLHHYSGSLYSMHTGSRQLLGHTKDAVLTVPSTDELQTQSAVERWGRVAQEARKLLNQLQSLSAEEKKNE